MPDTGRFPSRPQLDAQIDQAFLWGGYSEARRTALAVLGWEPSDTQLDVAIGRHAWLLGESRGDQGYQMRMARRGQAMPLADPDGVGAERIFPAESGANYFSSIERRFGIEIEFNGGRYNHHRIVEEFQAAGFRANVEGYNHHVGCDWKMITDATVTGGEFVSPILSGVDGHNQVRAALRAVRNHEGVPGQNQGMHIHHDVTDHDADDLIRLFGNLRYAQDALLAYVPRYRWNGSGSHRANRMAPAVWERLIEDANNGTLAPQVGRGRNAYARYVAFNANAILVYGSLEWRALGNTLNAVKIRTWIRIGQALIAWSKAGHWFDQEVTSEELVEALVREHFLPIREGERFLEITATRSPQAVR